MLPLKPGGCAVFSSRANDTRAPRNGRTPSSSWFRSLTSTIYFVLDINHMMSYSTIAVRVQKYSTVRTAQWLGRKTKCLRITILVRTGNKKYTYESWIEQRAYQVPTRANKGAFLWDIYRSHTLTLSAWVCSTQTVVWRWESILYEARKRKKYGDECIRGGKEGNPDGPYKSTQQPCDSHTWTKARTKKT